ncbi:hypothetical protein BGZ70_004730, partial [Mortierella alpina]
GLSVEDLVFGSNVMDGRHSLGFLVQCPLCKTFVFTPREKDASRQSRYTICCQQGKVHLLNTIPDARLAKIVKTDKEFLPTDTEAPRF